MGNYIEISIENISGEQSEILVAQLSELGFNGFEEGENFLKAFTEEENFEEASFQEIMSGQHLSYRRKTIEQKNWNEEWEKNFEPVIVEDFVGVRAEFHQPIKNVAHEIIITPKMSFGTGHHATTYMMMEQMRSIDFSEKAVFDFGTGTGILAILAEKLGAKHVLAIDNDEWSINNAHENMELNHCRRIDVLSSSVPPSTGAFDVLLANINKNVILQYLDDLRNLMSPAGQLLLSGLLQEDEPDILKAAIKIRLKHVNTVRRDKWISLKLIP